MTGRARSVGARSAVILVGVVTVVGVAVVLASAAGDESGPTGYVGPAVLILALLWALFLAVRDILRMFVGPDPDASAIADRLGQRPEQRLLLGRWLRRSRRYRNIGGVTGVISGFLIGGLGGMILVGLIGLTVGSLLAEVHLIRPERPAAGDRRTVGLERRSLTHYWRPLRQALLAAIGLGAVAAVVAQRFGWWMVGMHTGWAVAAAVVVVAALAIQYRVATRARPALSAALRSSDDLVRSLAITHGVANPALSLALAFIGQALTNTAPVLSAAAWLAAVAIFWRFRRLGLDRLLAEPPLDATTAPA